ncbi:glycosyltransferase [Sagittula salina]|uniref:Glycosyltransferase family 2 protein n=1 Tax=Sagittula salina TaxID=2820268 RepID=A0A940S1M8_9RHOB|nr:glycosyltransferase family A protein [Sagittula salina]MBP0484323.1 glycosyltransferase family 2 protein [Sagittula salina]
MTPVDVVLIGRNEGARLVAALAALGGQARQVVYVDSGSSDDSIAQAKRFGAKVVQLDLTTPFTAARARNAGFDALDAPEYVQFIDGDCTLVPGWLEGGAAFLDRTPAVGMVTGWRAEVYPEVSLYNRLCDWEWHRPAGEILACGGDMMVRASLWRAVEGMNPQVIAAEDDEVCCRFRKTGARLHRLPQPMTRHDAAMLTFGQWWKRAERTGHGFAQVHHLHPEYFGTEVRRVLTYGSALPLMALAALVTLPWLLLPILALYAISYRKGRAALRSDGIPPGDATRMAALLTLSKFPNLIGMARYYLRRLRRADMTLIEYK